MSSYVPFLAALSAFGIAYLCIPVIIRISRLTQFLDQPVGGHKLHVNATPTFGGVAIFGALFIAFTLSGYAHTHWTPYIGAGLTILFFSGIKDDVFMIAPGKKLMLQLAAIAAIIFWGDLVITDMGGIFGFEQIPYWSGTLLTFFTMVVVINAYNLIDGIDGLAAGIGITASAFFAWWFWEAGMFSHSVLSLTLFGSLVAFLRFNFQPAKIFMGDTGSQIVGYLLAFFAVSMVQSGVTSQQPVPFQNELPVLVLAVLIVPLYDVLRVFIVRSLNGGSPFVADRGHIHHQLLEMGFSHRASSSILVLFNLLIMGLTVYLAGTEVNILLGLMLLSTVALFPTFGIKRKILSRFGIDVPSRRQVQVLEMKYGMPPKRFTKLNGNGYSNGHREEEVAV